MRFALTIAIKDLRVLVRDRAAAFFTFVFPLVFAVLFGAIFSGAGGDAEVPVAVVDLDRTASSASFVEQLGASGGLVLQAFTDAEAAEAAVLASGGPVAAIIIASGFEQRIDDPFNQDQAEAGSEIAIRFDPSRAAEASLVEGVVRGASFGAFFEHASKPGTMDRWLDAAPATVIQPGRRAMLRGLLDQGPAPDAENNETADATTPAFEPARVETSALVGTRILPTAFGLTFPQGAAWGLMACVTGFGVSMADERRRGTLGRMISAGVTRGEVMLGKSIAAFAASLLVLAILQTMAWFVFGVRTERLDLLIATDIAVAGCFVGIMMLLSNIARSVGGSEGIVRAILLTLALIGGAGVPLFFMPGWMQTVSLASPFRWAIVAIENATWRNATWGEAWLTLAILVAIGGITLAIGLALFSRLSQNRAGA